MTDPERLGLRELDDVALRRLMIKTLAYAVWKLGSRSDSGPQMSGEDLAMKAITDTLAGQRNWNTTQTLEYHLRGCINSYISHYFDSLEGRSTVNVDKGSWGSASHSNEDTNGVARESDSEGWLRDDDTPEAYLEAREIMDAIDKQVRVDGDLKLLEMHELVWEKHLNLQVDRVEISERLGFDVKVGSAGYQLYNKLRNKYKRITEMDLSYGFPLSAKHTIVPGSGDD